MFIMRWLLAAWVLAGSAVFAQDASTRPLQAVGVFSAVRNTADHSYGQLARLWYRGSLLVGEVMYWDGNLEAQRGRFTDGSVNIRTGDVRFKVTLVRSDVQPNVRADAAFEGLLIKGVLAGKLTWLGDAAQTRGRNGPEEWLLRYDKGEMLEPVDSVEVWLKRQ